MTLPTTEQLEARFDELSHTDIEYEKTWFWYGIATYTKLVSEPSAKEYEQFKKECGL